MNTVCRKIQSVICCVVITALWSMSVSSASAVEIKLDPPGEHEFISDHAGMLDKVSIFTIKPICEGLLKDKATPIIVVTIESMAKYGGGNMSIENFANLLFDQWQIGHKNLGEQYWNTGILLLVSKKDRKARIELGAGWGRREDAQCQLIMDQHIIPHFKQGQFSAGIVAGVKALDKMGRNLELPPLRVYANQHSSGELEGLIKQEALYHLKMPMDLRPWWHFAITGLVIFNIVSLVRSGSSGWAWYCWHSMFTTLGSMDSSNDYDDDYYGGGGGFSGGSFGGGSSGGGGASGSW